ncbi:MAG: hypothetical protein WB696_28050 [Chthoniobacterales bacterium]
MKPILKFRLAISVTTAISLGLTHPTLADNYSDLAAQGYRWVAVDGPYACNSEEDVQRIVAHRTDATELKVVENIQCYYLIPGTIVQVIKEDPAKDMSQIRLGGITKPLWTYSKFLRQDPVQDTYGNIETPEERGLMPNADTAVTPLPSDGSTARTRQNGTP